ncbi:hypothetical protein AYI69_g1994 [Smittium culicis]|uniref:Uncharacterized protein n=1 Tax=Smittium culicis TaxID=133412 RepID=A0A1R1YNW4_9FUNG|nr:hypothetical protein AYI69_g1994 [Smittium culicis]
MSFLTTNSKFRKGPNSSILNTVDSSNLRNFDAANDKPNDQQSYVPPKHNVSREEIREITVSFMKQLDEVLKEWEELALEKKNKAEKLLIDLTGNIPSIIS